MTKITSTTLACPHCQHQQSVEVYLTLNVTLNPDGKEKLFNGDINIFKCEKCQTSAPIDTQFLYHDMELKVAVHYFPPLNITNSDFLSQFEINGRVKTREMPDVTKRIPDMEYLHQPHYVFHMDELLMYVHFRERLAAFNTNNEDTLH